MSLCWLYLRYDPPILLQSVFIYLDSHLGSGSLRSIVWGGIMMVRSIPIAPILRPLAVSISSIPFLSCCIQLQCCMFLSLLKPAPIQWGRPWWRDSPSKNELLLTTRQLEPGYWAFCNPALRSVRVRNIIVPNFTDRMQNTRPFWYVCPLFFCVCMVPLLLYSYERDSDHLLVCLTPRRDYHPLAVTDIA